MLRVVLDTNVFISSLLNKAGAPAQVLDAWRARHYLLITSTPIIAEIQATLNTAHIRKKYAITDEDVDQITQLLEQDALVVGTPTGQIGAVPGDPKDDMILACAVAGIADLIVSGDHHLLDLGEYQNIPIMTVSQFLGKLT